MFSLSHHRVYRQKRSSILFMFSVSHYRVYRQKEILGLIYVLCFPSQGVSTKRDPLSYSCSLFPITGCIDKKRSSISFVFSVSHHRVYRQKDILGLILFNDALVVTRKSTQFVP